MQKTPPFFIIRPAVQHYDWGGFHFLRNWLGESPDSDQPWAELWYGAHPKGPAVVQLEEEWRNLDQCIALDAKTWLGNTDQNKLPFLLKLLDVRNMLSIQSHPTRSVAQIGFEREEAQGIPLTAHQRVFKDPNHKPELMVALSPFYLLHGFISWSSVEDSIIRSRALAPLIDWSKQGFKELYKQVMLTDDQVIQPILNQWHQELKQDSPFPKSDNRHWALKGLEQYPGDRGNLSILWMNLVHLKPGEAIYQAAGVPHAYLEGQNVEIMANSDNVFRGGLTHKWIDVPKLLANLHFEPVVPKIISSTDLRESRFEVPIQDFTLSRWTGEMNKQIHSDKALIALIVDGTIQFSGEDHQLDAKKGQALWLMPNRSMQINGKGDVFVASFAN